MKKMFRRISKALVLGMLMGNTTSIGVAYGEGADKVVLQEKKIFKSTIIVENMEYGIRGIESTDVYSKWTASEGRAFLKVKLDIKNIGKEREIFYSFMNLYLTDKKNRVYNIVMPELKENIIGYILPKDERQIEVFFNIDKDVKEYILTFRDIRKGINVKDQKTKIDINTEKMEIKNLEESKSESVKAVKEVKENVKDVQKDIFEFDIQRDVELQNFLYKLEGVQTRNFSNDEKVEKGFKFIDIDMTAKNIGEYQDQVTSSFIFMLRDGDGVYQRVVMPEQNGLNGIVNTGEKIQGTLTFKVKAESKEFKLRIKPNPWNKYEKVIEIKLD